MAGKFDPTQKAYRTLEGSYILLSGLAIPPASSVGVTMEELNNYLEEQTLQMANASLEVANAKAAKTRALATRLGLTEEEVKALLS